MRLLSVTRKYAGVIDVFDDAIDVQPALNYIKRNAAWSDARVGSGVGESDPGVRNNAVYSIDPFSFTCPDVLRSMAASVWRYLDDYAKRYDTMFSGVEFVNVNRYEPGERYKAHADDGPGHNRVISALLYMNDVSEGGETEFIYHDVSITPRAGRLVIFPSNYAYAHLAHPPISGVKYSAAFWTVK